MKINYTLNYLNNLSHNPVSCVNFFFLYKNLKYLNLSHYNIRYYITDNLNLNSLKLKNLTNSKSIYKKSLVKQKYLDLNVNNWYKLFQPNYRFKFLMTKFNK